MPSDAQRFLAAFSGQLTREGMSATQAAKFMWSAFDPGAEAILGTGRRQSLDHLQPDAETVNSLMQESLQDAGAIDRGFFSTAPLAFILVPGYTHETLRHHAWHELLEQKNSGHELLMLHHEEQGPTRELCFAKGDGLRMAYLHYPRSNAAIEHIVPAMAQMLDQSASVQSWIEQGRRLVFVGYSYGSPLALELLAGLQQGRLQASGVLSATSAFAALCGDIGGAYLADDVLSEHPQMFSLDKLIAFCRRHPLAAKLAGLGTPQLMADFKGGVQALGHERRQARLPALAKELPPQLHYYSLAAMLPLQDYRRQFWHLNLDDYVMHRQAKITDPITVFNDGQVALPDNLLPELPQVAPEQQHFLGAVRTHHWGVSYRTFNFGRNRFPRNALYRAFVQILAEDLGLS